MHATLEKFGYPATLIKEWDYWVLLLRPSQPTLGSVVLAAKSDAEAFSDLSPDAFAELSVVTKDLERALYSRVAYSKINYLMLMMVDPHVHFHVIPRYDGEKTFQDVTCRDAGWPKAPDLGQAVNLTKQQVAALVGWLKAPFES